MTDAPLDATPAMRARAIAEAGSVDAALAAGTLAAIAELSLSEALVLGLLKQGVRKFLAIFGHGNTDLGEILRIYETAGVTRTWNFRNEVAMAHVATVLAWQYRETVAVLTSIGPGALQAMAGSLAAASNGVGVYHVYGDETSWGEGYNMQQIPKQAQHLYGSMTALMGESYVLHTPEALREALRRGTVRVHHPYRAGPFYLLLPINMQPRRARINIAALPGRCLPPPASVGDPARLAEAVRLVQHHRRIVIKAGGGARPFAAEIAELAEVLDAVVTCSPGSVGVLPDAHPRNMHVSGSKGSISGNHAMRNANLAVIVGSRAVCQSDCSGIGYEQSEAVININGDLADAVHYNRTVPLIGDIGIAIRQFLDALRVANGVPPGSAEPWLAACTAAKEAWQTHRRARWDAEPIADPVWGRPVLGQPTAIHIVDRFARRVGAVKYFDAGDVQANGFQVIADDAPFATFTESGASYMGFAPSAVTAAGIADRAPYVIALCGDGSFFMNPQVLIDAVEHGARGAVVILDNRNMAAVGGLQIAQYGAEFRCHDRVAVNYVALAGAVSGVLALSGGTTARELEAALTQAHGHPGLSVIHVPVYAGPNPLGGMGAFGAWNVGNWVGEVQSRWMTQLL
jgi:3D-(3,5/4)-trihydroxycyclohexane-1,2-dione acylhydrolase (decyclizing)